MLGFIINLLITALVVFLCAKLLPGVSVKSYGWACVVALVLAVFNALVGMLSIGSVGGGVLAFVIGLLINACLIWLADRFLDSFKVDGFKWCIILAAILALVSSVFGGVFGSVL